MTSSPGSPHRCGVSANEHPPATADHRWVHRRRPPGPGGVLGLLHARVDPSHGVDARPRRDEARQDRRPGRHISTDRDGPRCPTLRPGCSGGRAWWTSSTDCFHSPVHRKSQARTVVDEPVRRRCRGKLPRSNPCGRPPSGLDISYRDRRTDAQGGETRTTRRGPGLRPSRITADRLSGETPGAADDDAGVCTDRTVDRKRFRARETG